MGTHRSELESALARADAIYLLRPDDVEWDMQAMVGSLGEHACLATSVDELLSRLLAELRPGDEVVIMSNGGFGGLHRRLLDGLARDEESHEPA